MFKALGIQALGLWDMYIYIMMEHQMENKTQHEIEAGVVGIIRVYSICWVRILRTHLCHLCKVQA